MNVVEFDRLRDEVVKEIASNGLIRSRHEARQMAMELIELRAKVYGTHPVSPWDMVFGATP